jgi:hypothetical protein
VADVVRLSHGQALEALAVAPAVGARGAPAGPVETRVRATAARAVTATSARIVGAVAVHRRRAAAFVEYGVTPRYGARASARTVRPHGRVVATLTGLLAGTTYHYRVVVVTCASCTRSVVAYGPDRTFATAAASKPKGTYQNPVYGAFPDPMALASGVDYYAYGTGTNFPILHSTDLVHWSSAGTAFTAATFPSWSIGDSWSPSVLAVPVSAARPCPGFALAPGALCFYMYYVGLKAAQPANYHCVGVATSDRPDGGFKDQGVLDNGTLTARGPVGCGDDSGYSNIDPAPFVDTDGQVYLYVETGRDASGAVAATLSVLRLASDLVHVVGPRQALLTATEPWTQRGSDKIVEGPWMQLRNGTYYLFYSGGDFAGNYAMGYAPGPTATGPFTPSPTNPILKGTSQVYGPGGGSTIKGPRSGADQMIYHARDAPGNPRTLRIDRLIWNDAVTPATVAVNGPTVSPQPLP